jgi:hypothetical protein
MKPEHGQFLPLHVLALRLRALVLALGECAGSPWWKTEFMNETGLRFLERLCPRTFVRAAIHAAGKAACDAHDRAVGRVGVYHLFRLPESLDAEINRMPPNADQDFVTAFRAALGNPDKLMELLAPLGGRTEGGEASLGARRIGTDTDLMTHSAFEVTAALYHRAFMQRNPVFAYFAAEQSGGAGDDGHT